MKKHLLTISALCLTVASFAQWTSQATGFSAVSRGVRDVSAVDANTVWIATYDGSGSLAKVQDFSKTTDGGTTWTPGTVTTPNASYEWSCISAVNGTTAWACFYDGGAGVGGGIFKTTDGGATWTQQGVGTIFNASSFPDVVHFWDANTGFAMGDPNGGYFEIYTTTDGGTTWTRTPSANIPAPLSAAEYGIVNDFCVNGNTVWFGTNAGRVYKSTDKGLTWTVSVVSSVTTETVSDIAFRTATESIAIVVDGGGTVFTNYLSNDGGATWTTFTPTSGTMYTGDLEVIPNSTAYVSTGAATGSSGSSYTTDAGATWTDIDVAVQHTAQGWVDGMTGWSGGFNTSTTADGIYKYSGAALGVKALNNDHARMQMFPNPSTGEFTLQIAGAEKNGATVKIVDALGNVAFENSINNNTSAIKEKIDLSAAAKGVYFVTVENGTTRFVNKIVIK